MSERMTALLDELAGIWEVMAEMEQASKEGRRETLRECSDGLRMLADIVRKAERLVPQPKSDRESVLEELLRSACAIAERQGAGTAWDRFAASVHAVGLNGITARTYRVLPSDEPAPQAEPADAMTFDKWWDTTKTKATPATYAGWEHSCRQAWNAARQEVERLGAAFEDECNRTDSLLTILGVPAEQCRSEGGSLIPHKVLTLMGRERADQVAEPDTVGELPPLPEPTQTSYVTDSVMRSHEVQSFTADQMQAYARAALAAAPQVREPLSIEAIEALWDGGLNVHCGITALRAIARAIERAHGIGA